MTQRENETKEKSKRLKKEGGEEAFLFNEVNFLSQSHE